MVVSKEGRGEWGGGGGGGGCIKEPHPLLRGRKSFISPRYVESPSAGRQPGAVKVSGSLLLAKPKSGDRRRSAAARTPNGNQAARQKNWLDPAVRGRRSIGRMNFPKEPHLNRPANVVGSEPTSSSDVAFRLLGVVEFLLANGDHGTASTKQDKRGTKLIRIIHVSESTLITNSNYPDSALPVVGVSMPADADGTLPALDRGGKSAFLPTAARTPSP